jgi:hypothetical protein
MASILETFILLFKSDTTDLKKGGEEVKKVVNSVEKSLVDVNKVIKSVDSSFKKMVKQATGALVGIVGIIGIIGNIKSAISTADSLGKLSKALDANVEELSAWGDAVQKSGGTAEGFYSTVTSLTASLSDFATKGTSRVAPFFQELGIRMTDARGKARNFLDLLPEIASAFEKISKAEALGIGQKLGLDQGTILLLQKGRSEVDAFVQKQKELGTVTKKDTEIAKKFTDQWQNLTHAFRSLALTANSSILPFFTAIIRVFEKLAVYLKENPRLLASIGIALGALFTAFAPVVAIITAVGAALVLLHDDYEHFQQGHESLIGKIITDWPKTAAVFRFVLDVAKQAFEILYRLFERLVESIDIIITSFTGLGDVVSQVWGGIVDTINNAINAVSTAIEKISGVYKKAKAAIGFGGNDNLEASIISTQKLVSEANQSPLNSTSTNSILNSSRALTRNTTVQVGDVNIQTAATDAKDIAGVFSSSLEEQIKQAINNYDDGVLV